MNPATSLLVFACVVTALATGYWVNMCLGLAFSVLAIIVSMSLKMANVRQKFVIPRMGKLQSVKGTGLFAIIPVIDCVITAIDQRIQTTS